MEENPVWLEKVLAELGEVYGLGNIRRARYLAEGRVNHNFDVVTETGRYVVRRSPSQRTAGAIAYEHDLMRYLRARGFPAPPLVHSRTGDSYHAIDGNLYRITRFVEGEQYRPGDRGHLEAIARTLAWYHHLVRDLGTTREKEGFVPVLASLSHALSRRPRSETTSREVLAMPPALVASLAYLRTALAITHARLADTEDRYLPRLVIHGSCRAQSFIFRDGRVVAMLDYDVAYPDVRILDLAIALLDLAPTRPEKIQFDWEIVRSFLAAYQTVEPLAPIDLALLPWYMRAGILKHELRRYEHYLTSPTAKRETKLERGSDRLAWLAAHEDQLREAVGVPAGRQGMAAA